MKRPIYLDYNATSPIWPEVLDAMQPYLSCHFGNPSSGHAYGRAARQGVVRAREQVARLIGCAPEELIFTSGGTESNNLAIEGVMRCAGPGSHLVISAFEHPAVAEIARYLEGLGRPVTRLAVSRDGVIDSEAIEAAVRPATALVSVMLANNEIGTVQPVAEVAAFCRARGIVCHTDAAQCLGKIPVDVETLGVDLLSIAGHKMYAPKGVGGLFVRRGVELEPILHGASHEGGRRPGTENVASIVGLGAAAQRIAEGLCEAARRMGELRDRLEQRLRGGMGEALVVHGEGAERLPNTSSVRIPQVAARRLLEGAARVAASTGAACHSTGDVGSATLRAIGLSGNDAQRTLRLSLGWDTTAEEIDAAARELIAAWEAARANGGDRRDRAAREAT